MRYDPTHHKPKHRAPSFREAPGVLGGGFGGPLEASDLPDDLAELAAQLVRDADHLADLYPARATADAPLAESSADIPIAPVPMAPRRGWKWPVGTRSRVAAAVLILGGLALALSGQAMISSRSMWQGGFGSAPLTDSASDFRASSPAPHGAAPVVELRNGGARLLAVEVSGPPHPVFISTQSVQQLSGEEVEILADAIPQGASAEVLMADL